MSLHDVRKRKGHCKRKEEEKKKEEEEEQGRLGVYYSVINNSSKIYL